MRLVEVPTLSLGAYRGLFSGSQPLPLSPRLAEYAAARTLDRRYDRRALGAAELNAARIASEALVLESETLDACAYDDFARKVAPSVFGELCHAALESALRGSPPSPAERRILDSLPPDCRAVLAEEAHRMAGLFMASDIGQRARRAVEARTEWAFVLDLGEDFSLVGRMDLAFEEESVSGAAGEVFVVDFKTDRERREGEYDLQLQLYRRARRPSSRAPRAKLPFLAAQRGGPGDRDGVFAAEHPQMGAFGGCGGIVPERGAVRGLNLFHILKADTLCLCLDIPSRSLYTTARSPVSVALSAIPRTSFEIRFGLQYGMACVYWNTATVYEQRENPNRRRREDHRP